MAWRVLVGRCRGMVIVLPWPPTDRPSVEQGRRLALAAALSCLPGWGEQRVKRLAEPLDLVEDRAPALRRGVGWLCQVASGPNSR
jgi:hypothetical protein